MRYTTIWLASAIATFPLLVPPFFLPLYGQSIGLSSFASAALVSGFNLSSAVGRITFGQLSDIVGPVNSLIVAMLINSIGLLLIWPLSSELAPLILFVVLGGLSMGMCPAALSSLCTTPPPPLLTLNHHHQPLSTTTNPQARSSASWRRRSPRSSTRPR